MYALYQHYGFGRGDIGRLFIAGFGSSMIFGTIVGSLADKTCAWHWRRQLLLLWAIVMLCGLQGCPIPPRRFTPLHQCRGRKKAALTYVASYVFGCFTKHFNNFNILFVGRIFCGVATSLLFSAFESWLVAEHIKVSPACRRSGAGMMPSDWRTTPLAWYRA